MGSLEIEQVFLGTIASPSMRSGAGNPNGAIGGIVGDLFLSTDSFLYRCTVAHATAATWVVASAPAALTGASITAAGLTAIVTATDTLVNWWSAATWDTGAYWSGGDPSKLTAAATGYYLVTAQYSSAYSNATNAFVSITQNGVEIAKQTHSQAWLINCSVLAYMTAGQYVECVVRQESGSNKNMINASSFLQIYRLA